MIAIVFASEEEARPFLNRYRRGRLGELREGDVVHDGRVLVACTGLGKIKAALRTERLLQTHEVDRLLHAGTCTALRDEYEVGQTVEVEQVLEGDRIELAAPNYPRMPVAPIGAELERVTLVSQDHILTGSDEQSYWQRIAAITDTTGYPIAYVSAMHGVPCHLAKVVTGYPDVEDESLHETLRDAHETIASFLVSEVEEMLDEAA